MKLCPWVLSGGKNWTLLDCGAVLQKHWACANLRTRISIAALGIERDLLIDEVTKGVDGSPDSEEVTLLQQ
jgi:hypothetical protein